MKSNITIIAVILFAGTFAVKGQEFGVKGGVGLNQWAGLGEAFYSGSDYSEVNKNKFMPGFQLGGTFEYTLSDRFSLTTGLSYRQGGAKLETSISFSELYEGQEYKQSLESSFKFYTHRIEIPVMAKFAFNKGNTKVYGMAGAFANYGLTGMYISHFKYELTYDGQTEREEETDSGELKFNDDIQAFNIGVVSGLGVEIKNIQVEACYNIGLRSVFYDSDTPITTRSINLTIGYKFGRKG
jgi:hypothetical protein